MPSSSVPRSAQFTPRLVVNSVAPAVASAVDGFGVTRLFSYQVAEHVREGRLKILLTDHEYPPFPVHLVAPNGRLAVPKVRLCRFCRAPSSRSLCTPDRGRKRSTISPWLAAKQRIRQVAGICRAGGSNVECSWNRNSALGLTPWGNRSSFPLSEMRPSP